MRSGPFLELLDRLFFFFLEQVVLSQATGHVYVLITVVPLVLACAASLPFIYSLARNIVTQMKFSLAADEWSSITTCLSC